MKPCLVAPVGRVVEIILFNNKESFKVALDEKEITVEDACTLVAKKLNIGPLCRHLFSLKGSGDGEWLPLHFALQNVTTTNVFVYRIRYRVTNLRRLKELDLGAFDYYYHQVRNDVLSNNVRNLNYEKEESAILGLAVADMYRVMLEDRVSVAEIEAKYKIFIPKIILKNHLFSAKIKQKVFEALGTVVRAGFGDVWFVKEEYLLHFERTANNYLVEEYTAQIDDKGVVRYVTLFIDPFDAENPGIQYTYTGKNDWFHLCSIEDLCFVSIRSDGTIEICRKNGIPINFCFLVKSLMYSFVSLLDGYYRLSVKWTFNLCKEVYTPSLSRLHQIKCHGPVGGQFSYAKLQEKRENKPGSFILRECEKSHGVYYIDVCVSNSPKPHTYRIISNAVGGFEFSFDDKTYPSIPALLAAFKAGMNPELELLECIPPTESDKSQVLICASESWGKNLAAVSCPEELLLSTEPKCVNIQSLQVFPRSKRESKSGKTLHFSAMWKHSKRARIKVAIKELKPELREKFLSEFLELVGRWSTLQSSGIVKLYGITLTGRISMISEYLELGPLDAYLAANQTEIQKVDLVEAAASLAMALWQMEEAGITHGYMRCRKVLVAAHDANTLKIKLCDPGLHKLTDADIPWIPPECYKNMARAKALTAADVWAFGTTLWEIFSLGKKPTNSDRSFFLNGHRLHQPADCPSDIYRVMLECWDADLSKRKSPQAIMRDIYHILYQVFNSRRVHSYTTTYPRTFPAEDSHSLESGGSVRSDATDETLLVTEVPTEELIPVDVSDANTTDLSLSSDNGQLVIFREMGPYSTQVTPDIANMPLSVRSASYNHFMEETIFQLGKNCNVVLQGRIGQGNYGQVFKGILERADHEPQQVAVKQLKPDSFSTTLEDFEREISIMQELNHKNIVKIIGEIPGEISLVMEYVRFGSLQGYLRMHKDVLKPLTLIKFAEDVAKGMEYLGRKKIVHRDLAARNILVANENHVKISDFGLAQFVDSTNNDYYMLRTTREIPIKWYAPESLQRGRFSPRSDVWSYGVTLYEMFSFGEDPQLDKAPDELGEQGQFQALKNNIRLPCPSGEGAQEVYRALMMPCWRFDSKDRPSFTAIIGVIEKLRLDMFHYESKAG